MNLRKYITVIFRFPFIIILINTFNLKNIFLKKLKVNLLVIVESVFHIFYT